MSKKWYILLPIVVLLVLYLCYMLYINRIDTNYLFGNLDGQNIGEVNILMGLRKNGLFKFKIASLECDEAIFEYLFYGNRQ